MIFPFGVFNRNYTPFSEFIEMILSGNLNWWGDLVLKVAFY